MEYKLPSDISKKKAADFTRDIQNKQENESAPAASSSKGAPISVMLQAIIDATPLALNLWDAKMNNIACNKQVLSMFKVKNEEEYLSNPGKFTPEFQPDGGISLELTKKHMELVHENGTHQFKWLHIDANGEEVPAEIILSRVSIIEGEEHVVGFVRDLRPEFEKSSTENDEDYYFHNRIPEKTFLNKVAEISDDLFFAIDKRTKTMRFLDKTSYTLSDQLNITTMMSDVNREKFVHKDDVELFNELADNMSRGIEKPMELRFVQPDGTYRNYRIIYTFINDKKGESIIIVGKGVNIDDKKRLEEQAKYDYLTPCYSKANAEELISKRLELGKNSNSAILFVDVDGFKQFNEANGHYYGDEMLRQLVLRINEWCSEEDIVGRIGGDEFVVLVSNAGKGADFESRLDEIANSLNKTYILHGLEFEVQVSVGVALCENNYNTYSHYMQLADKALATAKQNKRGTWLYYDDSFDKSDFSVLSNEKKAEKITGINMDFIVTSSIFNILYERNSDNVSINSALRYLGQSFNACRCFILESFDSGKTYKFTHEWCKSSLLPHMQTDNKVPVPIVQELFKKAMPSDVFVCNDIENIGFDKAFIDMLKASESKAFVHTQVRKEGEITFCLGIEDCKTARKWTDVEVNTLKYMSKIFSIVLQGNHLGKEVKILSEYNIVSAFVADNTDNFIYIVDPDTFDIIHMNKKALDMYGNPEESVWRNTKCYKLLHNKTHPCEFCTINCVTENEFYEWNYYNPRFNKTYLFKDKLVPLNGKLVKLQVATDITKVMKLENELTDKLVEQSLLFDCIKMLHTSGTPDASIDKILQIVGEFFDATRCVIMQISALDKTVSNTHEYTANNILSLKHTLQNIPLEIVKPFFDNFDENGITCVQNVESVFSDVDAGLGLLKIREVENFIAAAISDVKGEYIGLFGIDNPKKNLDKYWILGSLSVFISDFLEKNKIVLSLNNLSYYDTLTGVKNRHSYRKALAEMGEDEVLSLGVAYVDITGLSKINEEKSMRYGDEVINTMARLLERFFGDNTYRVGGDEFVVLVKNISELEFENKIAALKNAIYEEAELKASVGFTWNIGYNKTDAQTDDYNSITNNKRYSAILSNNLDSEIKSGKYVVYLQSQINLKTNKLDGAEALIRRFDAKGNVQSPISFVPFYEKEGMISKIDFYVFETICNMVNNWNKQSIGENLKFSVNFSRSTVMEKNLVRKLSQICEKYGVKTSKFIVEITETISQSDDKLFSHIITSLRNAGFCVSLDDFGSGYANLSALKASDFDEIKIDMGLTRDLQFDDKAKILTKVALNLCDEFENLVSVAEGIETKEQSDILRSLNCQKGQGYYFSKPISISEFESKYFADLAKIEVKA